MNILLTGASRGIGAATFKLLRERGHQVAGDEVLATPGRMTGDAMAGGAKQVEGRGADAAAGAGEEDVHTPKRLHNISLSYSP